MAETQQPFADVRILPDGFSIPVLKWRELLFVGYPTSFRRACASRWSEREAG
jgi:hypothetical protein